MSQAVRALRSPLLHHDFGISATPAWKAPLRRLGMPSAGVEEYHHAPRRSRGNSPCLQGLPSLRRLPSPLRCLCPSLRTQCQLTIECSLYVNVP